ncbi:MULTISPECIES: hypothetical protein [Streptomyces]|uniref:hypothetical protein n=1 Tax=Streptomyces TaxID=1883 RepID=UPI00345C0214
MSEDELKRRLEALERQTARIGELEAEVARLREDAASSRALAGMADRDVAEMRTTMRGHTQVLNALRETQIEHGQQLTAVNSTLQQLAQVVGSLVVSTNNLSETAGQVLAGQIGMAGRQDEMADQLDRIESRLGGDDASAK